MTYNEFERLLYNADTKEDMVRLCVDNLAHAKRYHPLARNCFT